MTHPASEDPELRVVRWAGLFFAACALVLVPWVVVIAVTLPSRQLSAHYDVAWSGYDVLLVVALAATAWSAVRASPHLAIPAGWCAGLLSADAWFDVVTAPDGGARWEALAMAVLVELPLAGLCFWLALHARQIAERQLILRLRRRPGRVSPRRGRAGGASAAPPHGAPGASAAGPQAAAYGAPPRCTGRGTTAG
jgi:hypothetical protein